MSDVESVQVGSSWPYYTPSSASSTGRFVRVRRTSGNLTLNSATWADIPAAGALDLVLSAVAGDEVLLNMSNVNGNQAVDVRFDVATIVSAAVVNTVSGGTTNGITGWYGTASEYSYNNGTPSYVVVAGDIENGAVRFRLRYKTGSAADRTMYANANDWLEFWALNLGQVA